MGQQISVEGIECHAYHGCLPEEAIIGGKYRVDIDVTADVSRSFQTDDLADTVDYGLINRIARDEMAVPSRLIEHVAFRILNKLREQIQSAEKITVRVTKFNPPVQGGVERTTFTAGWPE